MTEKLEKTKGKRWVKILLIVSLGLNVAIATFVIGITIKGPPERMAPQNRDAVAFLSYALPKEHRREIRRELLTHQEAFRSNRNALRGLRTELISALEQEPFEIEAIENLLQRQRSHFLSMGELAHDALLRRIEILTPQEREEYIESLRREPKP